MYTYIYIHMYIHAYVHTYTYIYIYTCIYTYIYIHIYIYTYIYIYMYEVCIYMYLIFFHGGLQTRQRAICWPNVFLISNVFGQKRPIIKQKRPIIWQKRSSTQKGQLVSLIFFSFHILHCEYIPFHLRFHLVSSNATNKMFLSLEQMKTSRHTLFTCSEDIRYCDFHLFK